MVNNKSYRADSQGPANIHPIMTGAPGIATVGVPSSRTSSMENEDGDNQSTILRLREKLTKANKIRQLWMHRRVDLLLLYSDDIEILPEEEGNNEAHDTNVKEYEEQMAPITKEIEQAEQHYKLLKETLEGMEEIESDLIKMEHRRRAQSTAPTSNTKTDIDDNRKHGTPTRLFNYKKIPLYDLESMVINFNRVQIQPRPLAPVLALNLKGILKQEISLKVFKGVVEFLEKVEKFYIQLSDGGPTI